MDLTKRRLYRAKACRAIGAIFAADDSLSIACDKALIDCGVRLPGEILLVGFDDLPDNFLADHKISSLSVPKEEIAQTAVEQRLARMQGCFSHPLKVSVPISFLSRDMFSKGQGLGTLRLSRNNRRGSGTWAGSGGMSPARYMTAEGLSWCRRR